MKTGFFTKSSMDRAKAPEELNDYIRVESPGVWMILAAAVIFLIGVVIWGIFGTIGKTMDVCASVQGGTAVCYVPVKDVSELETGMKVTVADAEGTIRSIPDTPVQIDAAFDDYVLYLSGFSRGDYCYVIELELTGVKDGAYPAVITVENLHPVFFITH